MATGGDERTKTARRSFLIMGIVLSVERGNSLEVVRESSEESIAGAAG